MTSIWNEWSWRLCREWVKGNGVQIIDHVVCKIEKEENMWCVEGRKYNIVSRKQVKNCLHFVCVLLLFFLWCWLLFVWFVSVFPQRIQFVYSAWICSFTTHCPPLPPSPVLVSHLNFPIAFIQTGHWRERRLIRLNHSIYLHFCK